ncbi:hypothetical protein BOTBODRAFT_431751 [Botryobasidium botryosum FD-172 SS1]|uniref:Uncharacterized protein n=1 Tax=Botryobasidium botryosum (strain FD-172 SS1) TaxID=930990 RepID=A0A067M8M0_BOTB1|nr:hypothetical protein BOTBODRAFT_431751 [Botryobasidium botryosum FD-172 SS1]
MLSIRSSAVPSLRATTACCMSTYPVLLESANTLMCRNIYSLSCSCRCRCKRWARRSPTLQACKFINSRITMLLAYVPAAPYIYFPSTLDITTLQAKSGPPPPAHHHPPPPPPPPPPPRMTPRQSVLTAGHVRGTA